MAASSIVEVQDDVGPWVDTPGGVDVTPGNTISIRLKSTTGVSQWTLQVFGVDEVTAITPSLNSVSPSTHVVNAPSTVVTFSMPAGVGVGRALIFRSAVNGGGASLTSTFGVYVRTGGGYRVGAVGEKLESDPDFGWSSTVNRVIRDTGATPSLLPAFAGVQYAALMEDPVGTLVFQAITQDMIAPGFAISSFAKTNPDGGTLLYRRGDTLSSISCSAGYTWTPDSASVGNTYGGSADVGDVDPGLWDIEPTPFTIGTLAGSVLRNGSDLGADPTMTATLTTSKGAVTKEATFTIRWTRDVYYGVGVAGFSTEADIEGLGNSALAIDNARTFSVSPSNQKVYYAYPKAYGTSTFMLNNFPASFLAPSEISVTNINGVTSTYYLYESTNLLTGSNLNFVVA